MQMKFLGYVNVQVFSNAVVGLNRPVGGTVTRWSLEREIFL